MRVRTGGYTGPPIDFSTRQHIADALRTQRPTISDGIMGTVNQAPIVAFVVPVFDADRTLTGVLDERRVRFERQPLPVLTLLRLATGRGHQVWTRIWRLCNFRACSISFPFLRRLTCLRERTLP